MGFSGGGPIFDDMTLSSLLRGKAVSFCHHDICFSWPMIPGPPHESWLICNGAALAAHPRWQPIRWPEVMATLKWLHHLIGRDGVFSAEATQAWLCG